MDLQTVAKFYLGAVMGLGREELEGETEEYVEQHTEDVLELGNGSWSCTITRKGDEFTGAYSDSGGSWGPVRIVSLLDAKGEHQNWSVYLWDQEQIFGDYTPTEGELWEDGGNQILRLSNWHELGGGAGVMPTLVEVLGKWDQMDEQDLDGEALYQEYVLGLTKEQVAEWRKMAESGNQQAQPEPVDDADFEYGPVSDAPAVLELRERANREDGPSGGKMLPSEISDQELDQALRCEVCGDFLDDDGTCYGEHK